MKVRITDWFFFKKEAELKYVGLENALVKFQRTDSVWSQQFLFDYFSSPAGATPSKKKGGIVFNLKKVECKNVTFLKRDAWMGEDLRIHLGRMQLDADQLRFSGSRYGINALVLQDPVVSINHYARLKPKKTGVAPAEDGEDKPASWHTGDLLVMLRNMKIINGTFSTDKPTNRATLPWFDGQHILITGINGEWTDTRFGGDTVHSVMKLSAFERSGLELKNLSADLTMTPQGMFFDKMELVTNRSTLRNSFSMSYNDMGDLGNYIHKVRMTAHFTDSEVDSDDIAFFAPSLKKWKKKFYINGRVRGTVDDIRGQAMLIRTGSGTLVDGDISLVGLPDINKTFIDFKSNDFRTNYSDALAIIPALRRVTQPDLRRIQYVRFRGNFTGFIRDFVTFGTLQTNLGTLTTDINMKLPAGQDPVYSGKISTEHFEPGILFGDKKIGALAAHITVKGRGFSDRSRNTLIEGTIPFVEYNGYRYDNITVNGRLDKRLFEGVASISDEYANLTMNGTVDFNNRTPRFKLLADIRHADLKNLGFTRDSISFKGLANLDFTSDNIDNFLGTARITDAEIRKNGNRIPFDSLIVDSYYTDHEKQLSVVSNEFTAKVSGDFSLQDLPASFTYFLNKYYPAYIKAPKKTPANQDIRFELHTFYLDDYMQLIDSGLMGLNNLNLKGQLNLAENKMGIEAELPQFRYRQFSFDDVKLIAEGNADSLGLSGQTGLIRINDSLTIPRSVFNINSRNDSSRVSIVTGSSQTVGKADLSALLLTYNDGVKIEFNPSTFTINGKTWTIDENGEVVLRTNTPASGLLVLSEGDQRIQLKTQPSDSGNWNNIRVELTNLNLGDFAPYFMPKNRLEGLLSGQILVEDPTGNMKIHSDDIRTRFLRLDNDSLGEVKASLAYDNKSRELTVNGNTINQEHYLGFNARILIGDKTRAKENLIALKARNFEIKVLERFLGNLFSDMQGYLTGDINIAGAFDNLSVTGKGRLKDAGLKVNFTQCFYRIADTDVELTPTRINLDGILLTDTITRNPVYITGGIEHESFRNMFYDLDISTRKPRTTGEEDNRPVQLLNTAYRDNKQFYGNVKGTGRLQLRGPQSDMYMKIDAIASTKDSSYITIPPTSSRESGIADFLVERKYGREMSDSDYKRGSTSIIYDVDVTANNLVNVKVQLDELTGDEIKGRGAGTLNIRSGTSEPLAFRGRFDIEDGNYLFTFQSFFKKPFVLKKGADNYIEWIDDPYNAKINVTAVYTANNVSYAPLANAWKNIDQGISRARGDVYVVAKLTDKLFQPQFDFSLEFPASSVVNSDPALAFSLQQLQKNVNEMNKQATYLVVLGVFAPVESGGNFSLGEVATNSLSGIFFNVINEQVKKIVSNIFKTDKLNFNFNSSVYNRNIIDPNSKFSLGSNVNASLGSSLFKNRVIITLGGSVEGLLQTGTIQQQVGFLKDFTIEILINASGTFRANLFYREDVDYLTSNTTGAGRQNRSGAGLSYRRDFDSPFDFLKKKKKKQIPAPEVNQ